MDDRDRALPPSAPSPIPADDAPEVAVEESVGPVDLSGLSIAGITRRRVGWLAAALVSCWIVVVFARQVGEATTAADRAADLRTQNAALAAEVEALEDELALIVKPQYVAQQARGERLGAPGEIPFSLDRSVPHPAEGAPGSASVALGAELARTSPLESWLSLLFGPLD